MAPKCAVVFDFDGTLTPKRYISLFNVVEQGALSKSYLQETAALRNKYMPKAMNGIISRKEEIAWLTKSINIFIKAKTTIDQIKDALKNVRLRKGVVDCMSLLARKHIPIAVISYGIYQFVEIALRNNHVLPLVNSIYATKLKIDNKTGLVVGYESDTILLPKEKGLASAHFAKSVQFPKNKILAVGDSLVDSTLGSSKENRFGIAENEEQLGKLKRVMGNCAITEDFSPVISWLTNKVQIK